MEFAQEKSLNTDTAAFVAPFSSPPHPPTITALQVPALGVSPALGVGRDLLFTCE